MKSLYESIISSNNAGIFPNKDYKEFIEMWSNPKNAGASDDIYKNYIDTQLGWAESFWYKYMGDSYLGIPGIDDLKDIESELKTIFDALPDWKCLDRFWWFNEKVIKKNGLTVQDLINGLKKECGEDVKNKITDKSLR